MQLAMITAQQVIVLFILIFAGFICVKSGAVSIEGKKSFSDLLVYFVVPCMIVNSYLTDFDAVIFRNILYALEFKCTSAFYRYCGNVGSVTSYKG